MKKTYIIQILFMLMTFLGVCAQTSEKVIKHSVSIVHRGLSSEDPINQPIFEVISKTKPTSFYTDVESVICGSQVCKIVTVRLWWNELGKFTEFELAPNVFLEKEDGKLFEKDDYAKLYKILRNETSPLKDYYKEELVNKAEDNAVDALSGATISIDQREVVAGAIWTCYTLWHWSNGAMVKEIRNITAKKKNKTTFHNYLKYGNLSHRQFAVEYLNQGKNFDAETLHKIVNATIVKPELSHRTLEYLKNVKSNQFYNSILKLYQNTTHKSTRIVYLNAIHKTSFETNPKFCLQLSKSLPSNNSYQEIGLILNFLETNSKNHQPYINQILPLLKKSNFLISRKAYWFLKPLSLNTDQKSLLNDFYLKNKEKL